MSTSSTRISTPRVRSAKAPRVASIFRETAATIMAELLAVRCGFPRSTTATTKHFSSSVGSNFVKTPASPLMTPYRQRHSATGDFSAISPNGTCSLCSQYGIQQTALGIPTAVSDALGRPLFANTIYDPSTRAVNPVNNLGYATPFQGNMIPSFAASIRSRRKFKLYSQQHKTPISPRIIPAMSPAFASLRFLPPRSMSR